MLIALEFNNGDIKLIPLSFLCLLFSFLVSGCDYVALVGNGFCNDENNNPDCNYDGGDCCATNVNTNTCSECACLLIETCAAGYHPLVGNGFCNDETNIAECDYDGGDCCGCVITEYCRDCACLAGVLNDGITNPLVGDGVCNDEANNAGCNHDGGDCCLIVRVSLNNELLHHLNHFDGDYEISTMPNGHTSWINGVYAIWYISGHWSIGPLVYMGTDMGNMYAINDFYGLTDDENEWNYFDGSNWITLTDQSDIQITCVNDN